MITVRYICKISQQLVISVLFLLAVLMTSIVCAQNINHAEATIGQTVSDSLLLKGVDYDIFVLFQGDFSDFDLNPVQSPIIGHGTLLVKGEGAWKISVTSDTGGYMVESDDGGYIPLGRSLHAPMTIVAQGGNRVNLSQGGVLLQGSGQMSVPVTLEQPVVWSDEPLPQGRAYRLLIRFVSYRD